MQVLEWIGFAVGALVVLGTAMGVLGALVLPRRGGGRTQRATAWCVRRAFSVVAHRFPTYEVRDRILAFEAPAFLGAMLGVWLVAFLGGFALMMWPFVQGNFAHALVISSSSLFTLGFATQAGPVPRAVIMVAAATGLIIVALQIAYLPVLYASFNRRETVVTMLSSRAGVPAWGPEILARLELVDAVDNLAPLYAKWEEWAADVAESHSTYPVLLFFRSPHPYQSWIVGHLAVLDAAALHLATRPLTAPSSARNCLRMGYSGLRELARTLGLEFNDDPRPDDPISLTREQFDDALHHLEHAGWTLERQPDEAWVHFKGWRVNYEALAYALANAVDAPPALWAGPRFKLPPALQPPDRPPHREPPMEALKVRELTRQRRLVRSGDAVPVRHRPTTGLDIDETWGPMT